MRAPTWRGWLCVASVIGTTLAADDNPRNLTRIHEAGRCALRGQSKGGIFSSPKPWADNDVAEEPSESVREKLVELCGEQWSDTKVCCDADQLESLETNFNRVSAFIGSCPACQKNFNDLFCTFTCSPDQSLFVNVTDTDEKDERFQVEELDQLISDEYGSGFYNSCKDVSFTAGKVMKVVFGNSKNYTDFLAFLGKKKPLGSPFQINFPRPGDHEFKDMNPILDDAIPCNTTDKRYQCLCVDCAGSCIELPALKDEEECTVGLLPCLSFGVLIAYSVFIGLLVLAVSGHVAAAKHRRSKNERLQLLHDVAPTDDEDERDVVHGAGGLLDRPTRQYALNTYCDRAFSRLARTCANFPSITIVSSIVVVGLLSLGWLRFDIETDPVNLWVAPESAAAQEKAFFDSNFGPFFRAEQAFLVNDTHSDGPGPVLSYDTLRWWFDVERRVRAQKSLKHGYTFDDVCYKPLGDACVVQSVNGYFDKNPDAFNSEDWAKHIQHCVDEPADPENCLPDFMQPLPVERLLGQQNDTLKSIEDASALIVTWVVKNYNPGEEGLARAEEWEEDLKHLLKDVVSWEAKERGLRLSFNTEISLEQELNQSANTDAKIVVVSYIVMFIYASLALGSSTVTFGSVLRNPSTALVQSKFMLGIVGILIVLMSVAASVGLFSACGLKATLIIAEVIPFLVLAVGVDNIFLIVHEFERANISHADESVPDRIARALGRMGPSILLSASAETVTFALGAAVGMPAVRNFAAYAAGAVFINAVLQVTMFISVLALNQERVEAGRADCFPCIKVRGGMDSSMPNGYGGAPFSGMEEEGIVSRFIRKYYAPAILGNKARIAIMTVFLGFFAAAIALLPEVQLGLDQRIAIPSSSYLVDYFNDLDEYFGAGPPVYFVTREVNATKQKYQEELCAKFTSCEQFSVANTIELERKRSGSYIGDGQPPASWIDDFFQWLDPISECCMDGSKACFADRDPPYSPVSLEGKPTGKEFVHYAQRWLRAPTTEECPSAGQAQYADAVVVNENTLSISASHFRTAHSKLASQEDYIKSYASARRIAKNITGENEGIEVFPYSKHYIFFDMYMSIVQLSEGLVGAALAFILVIVSILLGSLATGLVVTVTVTMIVVDIVGTMALANVSLNAVSLVNIIICVGIGVEFCAHIARAFTIPSSSILERANKFRGKEARAWAALVNVGGSVFSGITITKLLGVFVLAFTRSKIFEIYYFRIWLALIVWAALHALVFLPVALSFFGGAGYLDPEGDSGLEQDLASRRYRALLPDEYDSDDF